MKWKIRLSFILVIVLCFLLINSVSTSRVGTDKNGCHNSSSLILSSWLKIKDSSTSH